MAAIANPVPEPYPANWVTPEEQLKWLQAKPPVETVVEKAVNAEVSTHIIPPLANIVSEYSKESPHWWYTALKRLQEAFPEQRILPERISPLPNNIHIILNGKSAVNEGQQVRDDHILPLIPQELGTIREMRSLFEAYGDKTYGKGKHPLKVSNYYDGLYEFNSYYADRQAPPTHFALITKTILPGTRNKSAKKQTDKVDALREKALVQYEEPTLRDMIAAIFLYYIATGEMLFPRKKDNNSDDIIYTRCLKLEGRKYVLVGNFDFKGLTVWDYDDYFNNPQREKFGIAGVRILP